MKKSLRVDGIFGFHYNWSIGVYGAFASASIYPLSIWCQIYCLLVSLTIGQLLIINSVSYGAMASDCWFELLLHISTNVIG